jgi:uncharacterized OB-fold protein
VDCYTGAPANFGYQAPYAVAIAALDIGNLCTQVVDCPLDALAVGKKVITVVRKTVQSNTDDVIPYGIK